MRLLSLFLACLFMALLVVAFLLVPGAYREYQEARGKEQAILAEVIEQNRVNEQRRLYLHHMLEDPNFLEQQARERLGYVRPDEIVIRFEALP